MARSVVLEDGEEDLESELSLLRAANSGAGESPDGDAVLANLEVAGERPRPLTTELLFGGVPLQIQMTGDSRFFPHGALSTSSGGDDDEETDEESDEQKEKRGEESDEQEEQDSSEVEEDELENEIDDEEEEEKEDKENDEEEEENEDKQNDDDSLLNVQLRGKVKLYAHGTLSKGDE